MRIKKRNMAFEADSRSMSILARNHSTRRAAAMPSIFLNGVVVLVWPD